MLAKGWRPLSAAALALIATSCATKEQPLPSEQLHKDFDVRQCPPDTRASPLARNTPPDQATPIGTDDPGVGAPLDTLIEPAGPGLWIGGASFGADDIRSAHPSFDTSGRPVVNVTFTDKGQHRFQCVQWGRINRTIEMSVDSKPLTRPFLNEWIQGNQVQISIGTVEESQKLAAQLMGNRAP